jgi:hypothetical protein
MLPPYQASVHQVFSELSLSCSTIAADRSRINRVKSKNSVIATDAPIPFASGLERADGLQHAIMTGHASLVRHF